MCKGCGKNHNGHCKYTNFLCNKCKVKGHLARVCNAKTAQSNNFIESELVETFSEIEHIYAVNNESNDEEYLIDIEIDEKKYQVQIDSGAGICACSDKMYYKEFSKFILKRD